MRMRIHLYGIPLVTFSSQDEVQTHNENFAMMMRTHLDGIPFDTLQRSGRATLHACELQTREQERSMGWMTLIVIELLGGWGRWG